MSSLESFKKLEGVQGAFIVNESGEVLEKVGSPEFDLSRWLPIVLKGLEGGKKASSALEKGALNQEYVEYRDFNIALEVLPNGLYLIVIGKTGSNLGRIRYEIKRSKKLIQDR